MSFRSQSHFTAKQRSSFAFNQENSDKLMPNAFFHTINTKYWRRRAASVIVAGMLGFSLLLASCGTPADSTTAGTTTAGTGTSQSSASGETGGTTDLTQPSQTTGGTTAPGTAPSSTTGATTSPSESVPTTTPPKVSLPGNKLVESYFGPLPEAKQVVPVRHIEAKALYLGAGAQIDAALNIARNSEVNSVVIDLKESDGVKYASKVPLAVSSGVVKPAFNLTNVIKRFHDENVKVIGRIVCFKDPLLAEARPDLTIKDSAGKQLLFSLEGKKPFVSPYNQTVWQYNVDIALEAIAMGVDEIQFDYIRFPTGGTTSGTKPYFGAEGEVPTRVEAINRFLQFARVKIQDETGTPLGADVFAAIILSKRDGEIVGQDWAQLGLTGIDNVSPMAYPSHFANSSKGHYTGNGVGSKINGVHFEKPDLKPYEVMYNTLMYGKPAVEKPGYTSTVRPYLQAFTAGYLPKGYYMTYDAAAISAQIKAIEDAGFKEWICWNPRAQYPADAFK